MNSVNSNPFLDCDLSKEQGRLVWTPQRSRQSSFYDFHIIRTESGENPLTQNSSLPSLVNQVSACLQRMIDTSPEIIPGDRTTFITPVRALTLIENIYFLNKEVYKYNEKIYNNLLWRIIDIFLRIVTFGFYRLSYQEIDATYLFEHRLFKNRSPEWKEQETEKALNFLASRLNQNKNIDSRSPIVLYVLGFLAHHYAKSDQAIADYTKIIGHLCKGSDDIFSPREGFVGRHKLNFSDAERKLLFPNSCNISQVTAFSLRVMKELASGAQRVESLNEVRVIFRVIDHIMKWTENIDRDQLETGHPHVKQYIKIINYLQRRLGYNPIVKVIADRKFPMEFIWLTMGWKRQNDMFIFPELLYDDKDQSMLVKKRKNAEQLFLASVADCDRIALDAIKTIFDSNISTIIHQYYDDNLAVLMGEVGLEILEKNVSLHGWWRFLVPASRYGNLPLNTCNWDKVIDIGFSIKNPRNRSVYQELILLTYIMLLKSECAPTYSPFSLEVIRRLSTLFYSLYPELQEDLKKFVGSIPDPNNKLSKERKMVGIG